jgi:hypothetical protein
MDITEIKVYDRDLNKIEKIIVKLNYYISKIFKTKK